MRKEFDQIVEQEKENLKSTEQKNNLNPLNKSEEVNHILKTQFVSQHGFKKFEDELDEFIKQVITHIFQTNSFQGVNFNEKDALYNKVFCYLSNLLNSFQNQRQQQMLQGIDIQ